MSKALRLFFFLGRPFSPLYSAVMKSREKLYHREIFRRYPLPVPVIAIGNLVLGGTGKTPTVQHIARLLLDSGHHPAIVSRGCGGQSKAAVNVVSDGKDIFLSPQIAGDEPYMLARSLPGVAVLTGARRIAPCRHAIDKLCADVVILDDGFQHLAIKRDIDIVLFDSSALAGNSRVFPGGCLREPISALNRCHAFLLTGQTAANKNRTDQFAALLQQRFPGRPVFISASDTGELQSPEGPVAGEDIHGNFFGFCGIANPERFKHSLVSHGIQLAGFQSFKDHTPYNQAMVEQLGKKAVNSGADYLITTEKDYVKLHNFNFTLPLYVLKVRHQVEQAFNLYLLDELKKISKPRTV
jgi:tetraacyldisaccharide 4'-kinase